MEEAPKGKATLLTDQLPETAERFTFSVNGDDFFLFHSTFSKKIVNTDYTVFALENLKNIRQTTKTYNKKLNQKIGNWSFAQLQNFIGYKSERLGKNVVFVRPNYTSQQCSKCGHTEKSNRNGNVFKCKSCSFQLDSDLNASRNIARIGRTDFLQASVNKPNVGIDENKAVEILNCV